MIKYGSYKSSIDQTVAVLKAEVAIKCMRDRGVNISVKHAEAIIKLSILNVEPSYSKLRDNLYWIEGRNTCYKRLYALEFKYIEEFYSWKDTNI